MDSRKFKKVLKSNRKQMAVAGQKQYEARVKEAFKTINMVVTNLMVDTQIHNRQINDMKLSEVLQKSIELLPVLEEFFYGRGKKRGSK